MNETDLIEVLRSNSPIAAAGILAVLYRKVISELLMSVFKGDPAAAAALKTMTDQFGQNLEHFGEVVKSARQSADHTGNAVMHLASLVKEAEKQTTLLSDIRTALEVANARPRR